MDRHSVRDIEYESTTARLCWAGATCRLAVTGVLGLEVGAAGEVRRPVDQVGAHVVADELDQPLRDVERIAERVQVFEDIVRRSGRRCRRPATG